MTSLFDFKSYEVGTLKTPKHIILKFQSACVTGCGESGVQSLLTVTAWVEFLPSPKHETCLCCSAMSGLMKLACLVGRITRRSTILYQLILLWRRVWMTQNPFPRREHMGKAIVAALLIAVLALQRGSQQALKKGFIYCERMVQSFWPGRHGFNSCRPDARNVPLLLCHELFNASS